MFRFGSSWPAALLIVASTGCDSSPPSPPGQPPRPERPQSASPGATSQSSANAQSAASGAALAVNAIPASVAGAWEGTFSATKGSVAVPENVKDTVREKDDGKSAIGSGKVQLSVSPEGDVTGSWTGALGKDVLHGKVEIDNGRTMLRATALSDDPTARDAMSGILVGELKADVFQAEIHVSAGDAVTVREASFDLHRAH